MTFRETFTRSFRHLCIWVSILFAALSIGAATQEKDSVSRPPVTNSPSAVWENCTPVVEGEFPHGVLVQKMNGPTVIIEGADIVGIALDEALNKGGSKYWPKEYRILDFCGPKEKETRSV